MPKWEPGVSTGNILTIVTMVVLATGSFFTIHGQVQANEKTIEKNEKKIDDIHKDMREILKAVNSVNSTVTFWDKKIFKDRD